ncbi:class I SAM-dependent methyltransferase [bacterium AH-315-F18]|nr:class I SAM-dependent methyltransferase [bacterium AH-315-F18]
MPADDHYRTRLYENYGSRMQGHAQTFDEAGAHRWSAPYRRRLQPLLPEDRSAAILDGGCGAGQLLFLLRDMGYTNLHGVDVSAEQVSIAGQICPNVHQGNVIEYLQERAGTFQLIFSFDVIEHLTKDEVLHYLDACLTALEPGGRMVIQTPNADSPWSAAVRYGDFTHETCFTPNALCNVLSVCGFSDFAAVELGPAPGGAKRTVRFILWQVLRSGLALWNLVETGSTGSGIFSRVFLASAVKPHE